MDNKIRVFVRVRPVNSIEKRKGGEIVVSTQEEAIKIESRLEGNHVFGFDRVFGIESNQSECYESVGKPVIADLFQGINGTIFAFGQTGAGKTWTMMGDVSEMEIQGIIPRAVFEIFECIDNSDEQVEFTIKASYVEVYKERIRDLLDPAKTNLQIRENSMRGVFIDHVTEESVSSPEEMFQILEEGNSNRAVAATGMNQGSSRSHSVFITTISQTDTRTQTSKSGTLYLVDLAGSEMVRKTGVSGTQLEEAKMINKSLSALGNVIKALTDGKSSHVGYRDSKLTRMLQESLGGNARTSLIVCCSPHSYNAAETLSTLRFGQRAKSIKNNVHINEKRSAEELEKLLKRAENTMKQQRRKIKSLENKLKNGKSSDMPMASDSNETKKSLEDESLEIKTDNKELKIKSEANTETVSDILDDKKNNSNTKTVTIVEPINTSSVDDLSESILSEANESDDIIEDGQLTPVGRETLSPIRMLELQERVNELENQLKTEHEESEIRQKEIEDLQRGMSEQETLIDTLRTEIGQSQKTLLNWEENLAIVRSSTCEHCHTSPFQGVLELKDFIAVHQKLCKSVPGVVVSPMKPRKPNTLESEGGAFETFNDSDGHANTNNNITTERRLFTAANMALDQQDVSPSKRRVRSRASSVPGSSIMFGASRLSEGIDISLLEPTPDALIGHLRDIALEARQGIPSVSMAMEPVMLVAEKLDALWRTESHEFSSAKARLTSLETYREGLRRELAESNGEASKLRKELVAKDEKSIEDQERLKNDIKQLTAKLMDLRMVQRLFKEKKMSIEDIHNDTITKLQQSLVNHQIALRDKQLKVDSLEKDMKKATEIIKGNQKKVVFHNQNLALQADRHRKNMDQLKRQHAEDLRMIQIASNQTMRFRMSSNSSKVGLQSGGQVVKTLRGGGRRRGSTSGMSSQNRIPSQNNIIAKPMDSVNTNNGMNGNTNTASGTDVYSHQQLHDDGKKPSHERSKTMGWLKFW